MFMAAVIPLVCIFVKRTEGLYYQTLDKRDKLPFCTGLLRLGWLQQVTASAGPCETHEIQQDQVQCPPLELEQSPVSVQTGG